MMMTRTSEAPRILLCALVRESEPPALQVYVDECFKCHRAVWRSVSSKRRLQAICRFCVHAMQQEGTKMIERPPSKKQAAEFEAAKKLMTEAQRKKRPDQ